MKNLKNIFTVLIIVVTLITGSNANAQDLSELSKDENFVSYVKDQFAFNKSSNIDVVNELASQGGLSEKQLELFYKAFNTNEEEYQEFVKKQGARLEIITKKYGLDSLSNEELVDVIIPVIGDIGSPSEVNTEGSNCWRRYRNTMAINAGVAVAAHIACAPSDVTVFVGALCHAAVTVVWAAANDDAWLDLQDCLK